MECVNCVFDQPLLQLSHHLCTCTGMNVCISATWSDFVAIHSNTLPSFLSSIPSQTSPPLAASPPPPPPPPPPFLHYSSHWQYVRATEYGSQLQAVCPLPTQSFGDVQPLGQQFLIVLSGQRMPHGMQHPQ